MNDKVDETRKSETIHESRNERRKNGEIKISGGISRWRPTGDPRKGKEREGKGRIEKSCVEQEKEMFGFL